MRQSARANIRKACGYDGHPLRLFKSRQRPTWPWTGWTKRSPPSIRHSHANWMAELCAWTCTSLHFSRGDAAQMEQQLAWVAGQAGRETTLAIGAVRYRGLLRQIGQGAQTSPRQVSGLSRSAPTPKRRRLSGKVNAALREAELGNAAVSQARGARGPWRLSPGRDVKVLAASTLARTSDAARGPARWPRSWPEQLLNQYPDQALLAPDHQRRY